MAREWVVFADTKTAPVELFSGTALNARVLSKDTTGDTFTVVIEVPAGWQGPAPDRSPTQYEEIYVLSGDVTVGETELAADDYRFCPPGQALGGLRSSKGGARIFLKRGMTGSDRQLVERLRADDMVWIGRGEGANVAEYVVLSEGTSGTMSRIYRVPENWAGRQDGGHFHTTSEEMYVISGDVRNDTRQRYEEGCYLFRPGGIMHGTEERSDAGCSMLSFFEEGAMDFIYAVTMTDPKSVPWE
jgi:quercetin dioxygenase-like cupin family protein